MKRTLKVTNIKEKERMALEKECLQRQEDLFFLKEDQREENPWLYSFNVC